MNISTVAYNLVFVRLVVRHCLALPQDGFVFVDFVVRFCLVYSKALRPYGEGHAFRGQETHLPQVMPD